ncbi:MAG: hypothetical protein ABS880_10240, partial [Psychrobacter alimentarius]
MNAKPIIFDGHNDLLTRLWERIYDGRPVHIIIVGLQQLQRYLMVLPRHIGFAFCIPAEDDRYLS